MVEIIIIATLTLYGLYFLINGSQEMSKEVRQNWAPQDIEMWQEERNKEKYIGQIILVAMAMYLMFVLI